MNKNTVGVHLLLQGHGGLLAGVERTLSPGETLVIGRSRSCHLSLRTTREFERRDDAPDLLSSHEFNKVSRIHCEIEFLEGGEVEIRDLSQNGTLVDGARVGRSHRVRPSGGADSGGTPIVVELVDGTWGKLLIKQERGAHA